MFRQFLPLTLIALAAAPAAAATYSAKPATPVSESRIVARDVLWACGPDACAGSTQNGRPLVVCQALAKKTGRIESFLVNGRAMAPADLERCNASAPEKDNPALANAR
jgi:hypothetical protein